MSQVVDPLAAGKEALERRSWREAYELLQAAGQARPLAPEELDLLAEAAFWAGNLAESVDAFERAFAAHLKVGNRRRAALVATTLAHHYKQWLQKAKAQGWLAQAERLLGQEPDETPEHGYLALEKALHALGRRDLDAVLTLGKEAERLGKQFADRALEIIGIQRQGMALVEKGAVDEGLALLDLASAAAGAGELDAYSTVVVYCNTIGACRDRGDYGRALEWADIAKEWCDAYGATAGFPGLCRVNRAEVLRHRGEFEEAEAEAQRAADELQQFNPRVTGEAFYEIGEVNLRLGRLDKAQEAFDRAHEFGRDPEPGQSLLRLAEGKVEAASRSVRHALSDESLLPLARSRLLPAAIEIALAAGDLDTVRRARDELVEIANVHGTDALAARAAWAKGVAALAEGDHESAFSCLRAAFRLWHAEVKAPYEAARVRVRLAEAYRLAGDEDAAERELKAARKTFDELGARVESEHAAMLLGVDTGRRVTRTFMFTDIVDSTRWAEQLGESKWKNLLRKHNDLLAAAIAGAGGEVVKSIGDGFFAAFANPLRAVDAAIAIQRTVDDELPFHVRVGLHSADATSRERDYEGAGVHAAARIGALAAGGEILASRESVEEAAGRRTLSEPRAETLRGFEAPVELVSVEWRQT